MSDDPRFPVECYVCGAPIEDEVDVVMSTAGWDYEYQVPCHRECLLDGVGSKGR